MPDRDDDLVRSEERAAEQEARDIGGHVPEERLPPEQRPLAEGGEGESEGFEMAERDLEANATHDPDGHGNPLLDRIDEGEGSGAEYGEADHEGVEE